MEICTQGQVDCLAMDVNAGDFQKNPEAANENRQLSRLRVVIYTRFDIIGNIILPKCLSERRFAIRSRFGGCLGAKKRKRRK
ncbi:hypothetical protein [Profundibacter sp.]